VSGVDKKNRYTYPKKLYWATQTYYSIIILFKNYSLKNSIDTIMNKENIKALFDKFVVQLANKYKMI
jgi:hypothetical protein